MKNVFLLAVVMILTVFSACEQTPVVEHTSPAKDSVAAPAPTKMKSLIAIFEIPATDISRAINFYQAVFGLEIEQMNIPGMQMGLFPYEDHAVTGILIQGEGYEPSPNGTIVYLDAGPNIQATVDRVERNGGTIIVPKTPHADNVGYFAIFLDSEGNKIGLSSPE